MTHLASNSLFCKHLTRTASHQVLAKPVVFRSVSYNTKGYDHTHTNTHTSNQAHKCVHTHTRIQARFAMHSYTKDMNPQICPFSKFDDSVPESQTIFDNTHTQTAIHTHTHTHTHIHSHICTHTQIYIHPPSLTHMLVHRHWFTIEDAFLFRYVDVPVPWGQTWFSNTHTHTHTHGYSNTHICINTGIHRQVYTQVLTHTYTDRNKQTFASKIPCIQPLYSNILIPKPVSTSAPVPVSRGQIQCLKPSYVWRGLMSLKRVSDRKKGYRKKRKQRNMKKAVLSFPLHTNRSVCQQCPSRIW